MQFEEFFHNGLKLLGMRGSVVAHITKRIMDTILRRLFIHAKGYTYNCMVKYGQWLLESLEEITEIIVHPSDPIKHASQSQAT